LARVVAERSAVSPEMALRLSRAPESCLAMQDNYDLWQAKKSANLSKVRKIRFAANAERELPLIALSERAIAFDLFSLGRRIA
jgi:plasmid maintenance system antidote protein VapI